MYKLKNVCYCIITTCCIIYTNTHTRTTILLAVSENIGVQLPERLFHFGKTKMRHINRVFI